MRTDRVVLIIVIVASAIAAAGCDGAIRVRGRVVDAAGGPISTARIHLAPVRDGRQFDDVVTSDGCFTLQRVVAPGRYNYTVRITAPGFKPVQDVLPTNEHNRAIVVLQPMSGLSQSSFAKSVGKWPESSLAASCSDGRQP
jgi:Carboxypeptidase regulatory-like domain